LKVNRLIRVSYGPFQLGDLPDGAVEEVKTRALREQLGERIAAVAGADFSGPLAERAVSEPPPRAPSRDGDRQRPRSDDRKPPRRNGRRPSYKGRRER
jgi:23S rRNA pseudouridine2605 synthase